MADNTFRPFTLEVGQDELDSLARRLRETRWPDHETSLGWTQGVPLDQAMALHDHWLHRYEWRRCEAMLNGFGQFMTTIDDLPIHFVHRPSPEPGALPLIMTHGWPGSIIEFHKVIGPLTDPVAHGGAAADAFHLVLPTLPGYGFSGKPQTAGWGVPRIAQAWAELMRRLGYERYVAQGGDWGSAVATALAGLRPSGLAGVHLNFVIAEPAPEDMDNLTARERSALAALARYSAEGSGYARQQGSRPQTLGYGIADSPMGQACWIYEKFHEWADCGGDPRSILTMDEMLDNIMLYWLPNSGASSARLYWESIRSFSADPLDLPVGCTIFPTEISRPSRRWAERKYPQLIHWSEPECGGHFAAFEQPTIFVQEVRDAFRSLR